MVDDPLGLRKLDQKAPPIELWNEIVEQLDAASTAKTTRARNWRLPAALAASFLVALIGFSVYDWEFAQSGNPVAVVEPAVSSGEASLDNSTDAMATQSPVARLQAVSKALEGQLANWQGGVSTASTADAIARMERQLSWLDVQLQQQPDDFTLWAERVALLSEMNQTYARTDWRTDLMLATY